MKIKDSSRSFDLPEEVIVGRSHYERFYCERKSKTCCEHRAVKRVFKEEQEDTATSSTKYIPKRIYRVSCDIIKGFTELSKEHAPRCKTAIR